MKEGTKVTMLKLVKPSTGPEKVTRTVLDTIEISPEIVEDWQIPPFQRPLKVNDKVMALAGTIKRDDGIIPGVITIGVLDKVKYVLDGQHRRQAYLLSGCESGYVDIRVHYFDSMAEMGEEFVNLNSQLVKMRPDDILRGLEGVIGALSKIRKRCTFVGYDMIRRSEKSPIVGMSQLLRCWDSASHDCPSSRASSAQKLALAMTDQETDLLIGFMDLAFQAWGRDASYARLWGSLNLSLCMWLYRRLVVTQYGPKTPRLTNDLFKKCLMSLSADCDHQDWLVGRQLSERDRSPCYSRIKQVFSKRIAIETGSQPKLPAPEWGGR